MEFTNSVFKIAIEGHDSSNSEMTFSAPAVSNDLDFETKAADVIGLYLNPPAHAAVFCVDDKSAIQALDRRDRMLPLSPGRAESHGFEYKRNGTLSCLRH